MEGRDYCIEMPKLAGIITKEREKELIAARKDPVAWVPGIECYGWQEDFAGLNADLFESGDVDLPYDGLISNDDFQKGSVRACLCKKEPGYDFVHHIDTGYVLIFPFEVLDNPDDYKLQYMDPKGYTWEDQLLYEHKYRVNEDGYVIPILHNGPGWLHTVVYNSPEPKWWMQIILNPKEGGWEELLENVENGNFYKKENTNGK
jgi:hypothetical protein